MLVENIILLRYKEICRYYPRPDLPRRPVLPPPSSRQSPSRQSPSNMQSELSLRITSKSSTSSKSSKNSKNSKSSIKNNKSRKSKNIIKKLAKTTDINIINKLLDEADDDNIVKSIIVRKTQILIQQKIEEQLKKCKEKLIDLESHYITISTYLHNNTQLQLQLQEGLLGYQLGKTIEAYSSATAKLKANVKAGNLHKKQREVEEAVKNVGKELELAASMVYKVIKLISERLEQLKRISNTRVGKGLLQINLQRGYRGYHLKTRN